MSFYVYQIPGIITIEALSTCMQIFFYTDIIPLRRKKKRQEETTHLT